MDLDYLDFLRGQQKKGNWYKNHGFFQYFFGIQMKMNGYNLFHFIC